MSVSDRSQSRTPSAIVTGGAQGIGFAVARTFAAEGCKSLALIGRDKEKGDKAVAELEKVGRQRLFISADVSEVANCSTRAVAHRNLANLVCINALVNAAATSARGSLLETTPELFDQMFHTNVLGPMIS